MRSDIQLNITSITSHSYQSSLQYSHLFITNIATHLSSFQLKTNKKHGFSSPRYSYSYHKLSTFSLHSYPQQHTFSTPHFKNPPNCIMTTFKHCLTTLLYYSPQRDSWRKTISPTSTTKNFLQAFLNFFFFSSTHL
jgi:hypothetical protein